MFIGTCGTILCAFRSRQWPSPLPSHDVGIYRQVVARVRTDPPPGRPSALSTMNFFIRLGDPDTPILRYFRKIYKYVRACYMTCTRRVFTLAPQRTDLLFLRKSSNKGRYMYIYIYAVVRPVVRVCVFFESCVWKKKWKFSTLAHCLTVGAEHLAFIVAFGNTHTRTRTSYIRTLRVHPSFPIVVFYFFFYMYTGWLMKRFTPNFSPRVSWDNKQ